MNETTRPLWFWRLGPLVFGRWPDATDADPEWRFQGRTIKRGVVADDAAPGVLGFAFVWRRKIWWLFLGMELARD